MKNFTKVSTLTVGYLIIIYITSALFEWEMFVTEWSLKTQLLSIVAFLPMGVIAAIQTIHNHEDQVSNRVPQAKKQN